MPIPAFAPVDKDGDEAVIGRVGLVCCVWDVAVEFVVEVMTEDAVVDEDSDFCVADVDVVAIDDVPDETDVEVVVTAASVAVLTIATPEESAFKSSGAGAWNASLVGSSHATFPAASFPQQFHCCEVVLYTASGGPGAAISPPTTLVN